MILDIFHTYLSDFKKYQSILKLIILRFLSTSGTLVSQEISYNIEIKDTVFTYNVHIYDKVRVLGIGRNQNQKLCKLHSIIIDR